MRGLVGLSSHHAMVDDEDVDVSGEGALLTPGPLSARRRRASGSQNSIKLVDVPTSDGTLESESLSLIGDPFVKSASNGMVVDDDDEGMTAMGEATSALESARIENAMVIFPGSSSDGPVPATGRNLDTRFKRGSSLCPPPCPSPVPSSVSFTDDGLINLPGGRTPDSGGAEDCKIPCPTCRASGCVNYRDFYYAGEVGLRRRRREGSEYVCEDEGTGVSQMLSPGDTVWRERYLTVEFFARIPALIAAAARSALLIACWVSLAVGVIGFFMALRRDVATKLTVANAEAVLRAAGCQAEYERNRCDPLTRVPAMESLCREWQVCGRAIGAGTAAAISAETLGLVVSAFFEQLTLKAGVLLVCIAAAVGTVFYFHGHAKNAGQSATVCHECRKCLGNGRTGEKAK